jgi:ferric-dicitrate binding protein FerR (iron transport regulator)
MSDELLYRYLRADVTDPERRQVDAWLASSPGNQARLAELVTLLDLADRNEAALPTTRPPSAATLIRRAEQRTTRDRPLVGLARWLGYGTLGLSAVAVILIAAVMGYRALPTFGFTARDVLTGPGEMATVALNDGTLIRLGPESQLRIGTGQREREVALEGHAFVDGSGAPGHELDVVTRAGTVAARGARFDLQARHGGLTITMASGAAIVSRYGSRQQLSAGQVMGVRDDRLLAPWTAVDLAARIAWAGDLPATAASICDVGRAPCPPAPSAMPAESTPAPVR